MSVEATLAVPPRARPVGGRRGRMLASGAAIVTAIYVILYALYGLWEPSAFSAYTFGNLINNASPLAIAAAGETLVVLTRGFDLSVAGVMSLSHVIMATYPVEGPGGAVVSLLLCMAVGACVGAVNG